MRARDKEPQDTVQDHMARALEAHCMMVHWAMYEETEGFPKHAAATGETMGHLFRAAEIAHDLGFAHPLQNRP